MPMIVGSPKCFELGFDFGFESKHGDQFPGYPACVDTPGKDVEGVVAYTMGELQKTPNREGMEDCDLTNIGEYRITCGQSDTDESEYVSVHITSTVDVSVFVQGGNGGMLYNLTADYLYEELSPGNGAPIDHIEFCFYCATPSPTPGPTPKPSPVPSEQPSEKPSLSPSDQPSEHPSVSPSHHPSAPPSDQPTAKPTLGEV